MARDRHFGSGYSRFGEDGFGQDINFYGDTSTYGVSWDASANTLTIKGAVALTGTLTATTIDSPSLLKRASGSLTAGNANAWAFSWVNPESSKIIVSRVVIYLTTAGGTGSSVLNVGPGATATTADDTLIDGLDLNTTGVFDNVENQGTNGKSTCVLDESGGTTTYINGQILVANAASLVGKYYIYYMTV